MPTSLNPGGPKVLVLWVPGYLCLFLVGPYVLACVVLLYICRIPGFRYEHVLIYVRIVAFCVQCRQGLSGRTLNDCTVYSNHWVVPILNVGLTFAIEVFKIIVMAAL